QEQSLRRREPRPADPSVQADWLLTLFRRPEVPERKRGPRRMRPQIPGRTSFEARARTRAPQDDGQRSYKLLGRTHLTLGSLLSRHGGCSLGIKRLARPGDVQ